MGKVVQFRCPIPCGRLLIKYEKGSSTCIYQDNGLQFVQRKGSEKKDVICSKCNRRLEITTQGLREIELVET